MPKKAARTLRTSSLNTFTTKRIKKQENLDLRKDQLGDWLLPSLALTLSAKPSSKTQDSTGTGVIRTAKVTSTMTTTDRCCSRDGDLNLVFLLVRISGRELIHLQQALISKKWCWTPTCASPTNTTPFTTTVSTLSEQTHLWASEGSMESAEVSRRREGSFWLIWRSAAPGPTPEHSQTMVPSKAVTTSAVLPVVQKTLKPKGTYVARRRMPLQSLRATVMLLNGRRDLLLAQFSPLLPEKTFGSSSTSLLGSLPLRMAPLILSISRLLTNNRKGGK